MKHTQRNQKAATIKTYRFYFQKGVPILDWPHGKTITGFKWGRGKKSVFAYSLTDAMERLVKPIVQRTGLQTRLYLEQCFVSRTCSPRSGVRADWDEINLDAATIAAFTVGALCRETITNAATESTTPKPQRKI